MSDSKVVIVVFRWLFNKLRHTRIMTQNMRSPGNGLLGHVARSVMSQGNELVSQDAAERLDIKTGECVLEVGPGNGHGIEKILSYKPSQVLGIEISESYRESLENKFENQNVVILANDAKELNNVVSDSSVDKLLAVNVIYFLEPLESYVNEFYRIIKKGGEGIIACKFHGVASFDDSVAVNKDIDFVTSSFEKGGFLVSHANVDLGSDFSKYTAITIKK